MITNKRKQQLPRVLIPSIRNMKVLPPVINLINCLGAGLAKVTLISYDLHKDSFRDEIELIQISKNQYPRPYLRRLRAKLHAYLFMYCYLFININKFDYIWFGVWDYPYLDFVAKLFGFRGKIIYHFHELEFNKLKYCRRADFCIVPEENRLWITYFLGKLKKKPLLLPNIPFLPFNLSDEIPNEFKNIRDDGKKILLYQGLIDFDGRCLNELLEALTFLTESIILVIMPIPYTMNRTIELLKERIVKLNISKKTLIICPQISPYHLNYIKYADLGIGLYRPTSLNQIYAAPNRLFEFTKFSIPVILPNFPSFKSLSSFYKNGIITVNPESPVDIAKVILNAFDQNNLAEGRKQAKHFFDENGNFEKFVENVWKQIIN